MLSVRLRDEVVEIVNEMREIKQIIKIANKYDCIDKITLFGSRARGDNRNTSDFDIAIYCESFCNDILLDLEEIETLLNIDVTIIEKDKNIKNKIDENFLENIKLHEVIIFMNKFEFKLNNFRKAVDRLEEVLRVDFDIEDDRVKQEILRDSIIQRFEFCYELAWKTLREYLLNEGLEIEPTPRKVFKSAYQNCIIDNSDTWLNMIKDRNVSSHEYNEQSSIRVSENVEKEYLPAFKTLILKLEELNKE